ncbi:hypothetical protein [Demequina aurantiaca]|uniref:hypothetical protein n=1 Tax=Demequina aurantiaca TaxID=676200 RepID=UPI003D35573B
MNKMTGPARRGFALAALSVTATLMLGGCGEKQDESEAVGESGAFESAAPDATETAPSPTAPATYEPTSPPAPSASAGDPPEVELAGKECLPGNWILDNNEFGALMSAAAGSTVSELTGNVMVTFREDGTTSTSYDEWTYALVVDGSQLTLSKNGTDHGTYRVAADGTMSMVDTDLSSVSQMELEVDGSPVINTVQSEPSVFGSAAFTCAGDELTVTADGATTVMHREH